MNLTMTLIVLLMSSRHAGAWAAADETAISTPPAAPTQTMVPAQGAPAAPPVPIPESELTVFPPPPDRPRIRFIRSIRSLNDLKGDKGGVLAKIFAWLAGGALDQPLAVRPHGIWGRGGLLYITDTGAQRLLRLDLSSSEIKIFGEAGAGELLSPIGIATDPDGNVYVTDTGDHSVKAYSKVGNLMWQTASLGGEAGKLDKPSGIAWTSSAELLVLDSGNHRAVVLGADGRFRREMCRNLKDPYALPNPAHLWVEVDGGFIVSDPLLGRVHIFDKECRFVSGFGELGDSAGYMARPRGVASDSDGNVYVVDAVFSRVQMFDRNGRLLMYFASPGQGQAQLALPAGIYIDPQDRIYVVDSKNRRVQVYQYIKAAN